MGPFLSYLLQVTFIMTLLFLCYRVLLSSATFHAFKRFTLLGILAFSWLLPLAVPRDSVPFSHVAEEPDKTVRSGNVAVEIGTPIQVTEAAPEKPVSPVWHWLVPVYICGAACVLTLSLIAVMRLMRMIRGGERRRLSALTLVLNPGVAGPCSWGRYIVMRPADCDADMSLVMTHELQHLRRLHWLDTIFAQLSLIFLWFNPVSYMIVRELKAIHEYDADRAIPGDQTRRYQLMLIKKTVGSSFPTFANSLYHSQIKKRITMMMKRKSSAARLLTALALPGAAALAMLTLSQPSVAQILAEVSASSLEPVSGGKVTKNSADTQIVDAVEAIAMPDGATAVASNASNQDVTPGEETASVTVVMNEIDCIGFADSEGESSHSVQQAAPAYFVDGKLFTGSLNDLNPSDIKSMTVVKDDPAYPNGKIMIEMKTEADKVALVSAKTAEFKGGSSSLYKFIAQNIKYPADLKTEARPIVQFTVDTDGEVSDFKVLRSGGEAADAEAIRVISLTSGGWAPAQDESGKAIATRYVMPIVFKKM